MPPEMLNLFGAGGSTLGGIPSFAAPDLGDGTDIGNESASELAPAGTDNLIVTNAGAPLP